MVALAGLETRVMPVRVAAAVRTPFRTFAGVQAGHSAGDAALAVALAGTLFFSVPAGAARSKIALYLVLTMVPFALLAPFLGRVIDSERIGPRRLLTTCGAVRVACAIVLVSRTSSWQMYPLVLAMLVASRAHGIGRAAAVPLYQPPAWSAGRANATLSVVATVGGGCGAAIGVGVGQLAPGTVLWWAATAYAANAALALALPRTEEPAGFAEPRPRPRRLQGWRCGRDPVAVRSAGVGTAGVRWAVGFTTFFLALAIRQEASASAVALAAATAAVGAGAGSVLGAVVQRFLPEWVVPTVVLLPIGAAAWYAASRFDLHAALVVAAAVGFASSAGRLGFDSATQRQVPDTYRGSVMTRWETVFQLSWVAGAVVSMLPLAPRWGMLVLLVASVGAALATVRCQWRGRRREAPGQLHYLGATSDRYSSGVSGWSVSSPAASCASTDLPWRVNSTLSTSGTEVAVSTICPTASGP